MVNGSTMRILKLFIVVLGVILLLWVAIDHVPLLLQVFGRSVEGRITGKYVKYHSPEEEAESGVLSLRYEFEAGGARHVGDASVPRSVYNASEPGGKLTVHYLRARPAINLAEGYLGQGVRGLPLLITGSICFITGFFLMRRASFTN